MYNILQFEWDPAKDTANQEKHGVPLVEAVSVFSDSSAGEFADPDHSREEERLLLLGISGRLRVLVVCFCLRRTGNAVRIISARKANEQEEKEYWRMRP